MWQLHECRLTFLAGAWRRAAIGVFVDVGLCADVRHGCCRNNDRVLNSRPLLAKVAFSSHHVGDANTHDHANPLAPHSHTEHGKHTHTDATQLNFIEKMFVLVLEPMCR